MKETKGQLSINMSRNNDRNESYEELDVSLSEHCALVGKRSVNVTKSFLHRISIMEDAVVTVVRNFDRNSFHLADEKGNYDDDWRLVDSMKLQNVKFTQGLVLRGMLKATSYHIDRKYCKQLDINKDKLFTLNGIPVMTADYITIESGGQIWGRKVK